MTDRGLVATEIMPGIDPRRDIVDASLGRVSLARLKTLPASLLGSGPMGLALEPYNRILAAPKAQVKAGQTIMAAS